MVKCFVQSECCLSLCFPDLIFIPFSILILYRCFLATSDPVKIIVFQDLKSLNFTMADRKLLLDLKHCQLVLEKLGRFHAASIVMSANKSSDTFKSIEKFNFGLFNPNGKCPAIAINVFGKGLSTLINVVGQWSGDGYDYKSIIAKLKSLEVDFYPKILKTVAKQAKINVLNHGDMWVNNFLFKYNEQQSPTDVIFVDYQMSFYSSPGIDVNYFLNTSPNCEVREINRDKMIEYYYDSLKSTLEHLRYKNIPTFAEILDEIRSQEFYGLIAAIGVLPIVLMEKQAESSGIDAMVDEEMSTKIRNIMYYGQKYQRAMKFILRRFDEIGVLDEY